MSTLRKHVKAWEKVAEWTMATFRRAWPAEPAEFAQYLECRADEPCGRTVPNSIFKTLLFRENVGEIPPEEEISRSPVIKNVLEEINMQLAECSGASRRGHGTCLSRWSQSSSLWSWMRRPGRMSGAMRGSDWYRYEVLRHV